MPDDEALTRLSIAPVVSISGDADVPESRYITDLLGRVDDQPARPIIYATRPYVILSRLIGHVAGFVFAGGSDLCHLAILLREDHIPAIVASLPAVDGDYNLAVISNGHRHLTAPAHIGQRRLPEYPGSGVRGPGSGRASPHGRREAGCCVWATCLVALT